MEVTHLVANDGQELPVFVLRGGRGHVYCRAMGVGVYRVGSRA